MSRQSCLLASIILLAGLAVPAAGQAPPVFECEPGGSPGKTECRCLKGFIPVAHQGVATCDCPKGQQLQGDDGKQKCVKPSRSDVQAHLPVMQCGTITPLLRASCTSECNNDQRNTHPVHVVPLSIRMRPFDISCSNGPSASAWLEAFCSANGASATLTISASARRSGGCTGCVGSGAYAAYEWIVPLPAVSKAQRDRYEYSIIVKPLETAGATASQRCKLYLGGPPIEWGTFSNGEPVPWDGKANDLKLTCTSEHWAYVGAGMQGGTNCRDVSESGAMNVTVSVEATKRKRKRPGHR